MTLEWETVRLAAPQIVACYDALCVVGHDGTDESKIRPKYPEEEQWERMSRAVRGLADAFGLSESERSRLNELDVNDMCSSALYRAVREVRAAIHAGLGEQAAG